MSKGRPRLYTGEALSVILALVGCHGARNTVKLLKSRGKSAVATRVQVAKNLGIDPKKTLEHGHVVSAAWEISEPTVQKLAKENGVKLQKGRPSADRSNVKSVPKKLAETVAAGKTELQPAA